MFSAYYNFCNSSGILRSYKDFVSLKIVMKVVS